MRQRRRADDRRVGDAHAMMDFVAFLQAAQDRDGVFHRRLADVDRLKAPFQRRIFFDSFAVFVQRGRADAAQLAARQRRLEHVRRVHRAFGGAGADQRVQFVDEQNDLAAGFGDFLQHGFEPVFEFAAKFCAGDQRAQVQRDQLLVFQSFGHVAVDDAQRETFDDGGFADARLADQHRIILRAARQHLDDPANFVVAPDHRIELALAREIGEVAAVLFQRLIFFFGIRIGDPLRAANADQGAREFYRATRRAL